MPAGKSPNQIRNNINARRARGTEVHMIRLSELMLKHPCERQAWYAEKLNLSKAHICRLMKRVYQFWREEKLRNFDELVVDELNRLDWVEKEAREAWEKSKEPKDTVIKDVANSKEKRGVGARVRKITERSNGDARFMEVILKASDARRKILGIDAPVKVDARVQVQQELSIAAEKFRTMIEQLELTEEQAFKFASLIREWSGAANENQGDSRGIVDAKLLGKEGIQP